MIKFSNRSRETANDWQPIHFVQPIIQPGPLCSNLATGHNLLPTNHFDRVTHQQQQIDHGCICFLAAAGGYFTNKAKIVNEKNWLNLPG